MVSSLLQSSLIIRFSRSLTLKQGDHWRAVTELVRVLGPLISAKSRTSELWAPRNSPADYASRDVRHYSRGSSPPSSLPRSLAFLYSDSKGNAATARTACRGHDGRFFSRVLPILPSLLRAYSAGFSALAWRGVNKVPLVPPDASAKETAKWSCTRNEAYFNVLLPLPTAAPP